MKILVIDDDNLVLYTLSRILERNGYEVVTATDGRRAMAIFRAERPDVVITDLIMPDTDGLEPIQELRKIDPTVRILAISGGGRVNAEEYLSVARKFGAYRKEGYAERALFVVDKQGKIVYKDIHKIDEQPDNEEIFKVLRRAA